MSLHFTITCDEVSDFQLRIAVPNSFNFLELSNAIFEALSYDASEMTSFSICDSSWVPTAEVQLFDTGLGLDNQQLFLMEETLLEDFFLSIEDKALFTFDILGDRAFYLEVSQVTLDESKEVAILSLTGTPPTQTSDINQLLSEDFAGRHRLLSTDNSEEEEDDLGFDLEELDHEGFDFF